jgi:hypothetical protein
MDVVYSRVVRSRSIPTSTSKRPILLAVDQQLSR